MSSSHVFAGKEKRQREEEEVNDEVRSKDNRKELPERVEGGSAEDERAHSDSIAGRDTLWNLLASLSPSSKLQFLVRVGCVVEPLPGTDEERKRQPLDENRDRQVSQVNEVVLYKIGILEFAQAVMMPIVVLHVPRLGQHPIEPIAQAFPGSADGKFESVPTVLVGVALVVSTVAGVMSDHRPASEGECGQCDDRDGVDAESHGEHAHESAGVGPHDHFVQVFDVRGTLVLLELVSELLDVFREGIEVEVLDPLVGWGELGRLSRGLVLGNAHN
mmetsp:Transcript_18665/g.32096  ORF Transcript_18665/g.32096 Transcript_18665/m.32096 type:complete len:274 (+) Transcript_18665:613-1434(+)